MTTPPAGPNPAASPNSRNFELRIVAFVDVLGSQENAADVSFMNAIVETAELQTKLAGSWPSGRQLGFRSTWFSDNLGVSLLFDPSANSHAQQHVIGLLVRTVAGVQARLLSEYGLLSRGGIALGQCYHDGSHIFGPALVDAYRLEWAAESPRVVLSEDVHALAGTGAVPLLEAEPLRQREGWALPPEAVGIDFMQAEKPGEAELSAYLTQLRRHIDRGAATARGPAKEKWLWARQRLDAIASTDNEARDQ